MRCKRTRESANALINNKEISFRNTEVVDDGKYVIMRLHNHEIARKHKQTGVIQISTQGWNTNLTQRRLNGVLEALGSNTKLTRQNGSVQLGDEDWENYWDWKTIVTASGDFTV